MAETALELREILDAAERAAAAEDFLSAEQHLRQAAILQEQQLGPGHPDLANTLNNLGIVSEYVGKPADAEACYRRAYRIASAALPADHSLVLTSGKNLKDFCEAIGKPAALPEALPPELETFAPEPKGAEPRLTLASAGPVAHAPPSPPPASPTQPPAQVAIRDLPLRPAEDRAPAPPSRAETATIRVSSPVSPPSNRPTTAIAIVALVVLAGAAWWFGLREPSSPTTPVAPAVETAPPREDPPAASTETPVAPREEPPPPSAVPEPPAAQVPTEAPPIAEAPATPVPTVPAVKKAGEGSAVSVVDAKVCRSLSTSSWTCNAAANPSSPGAFFFYTRVRSARDTTVQHRWLMDGRVLRSVNLRIRANPGEGYRTYSRNTVSAERRGNWTLELRDADGALLQEERLTVK